MLQAILHGKADQIKWNGESLRWRDLFKRNEDLMTAAFFGRVPYLSDSALGALLRFLLGDHQIDPSTFDKLELWPHLKFKKRGHVYIEPDVLLHFTGALVVIEVKPPFGDPQDRGQWRDQVEAVDTNIKAEREPYSDGFYYVALGNNFGAPLTREELPERFRQMTQREWEPLRRFLQTSPEFDSCRQDRAIRDEWQQAFVLFGMSPLAPIVPEWTPLYDLATKMTLDCKVISELTAKPIDWSSLLNYAGTLRLSSHDFSL